MIEIQVYDTSQDISELLEGIVNVPGMDVFGESPEVLLEKFNRQVLSKNMILLLAVSGGRSVAMGGMTKVEAHPYYDIVQNSMGCKQDVLGFGCVFILDGYRQMGVYSELYKARMILANNTEAEGIIVEPKAEYIQGKPNVHRNNIDCWVDPKKYLAGDVSLDCLSKPLNDKTPSICPNCISIEDTLVDDGFQMIGISPYDNCKVYFKEL